jgi:hypothetical protein
MNDSKTLHHERRTRLEWLLLEPADPRLPRMAASAAHPKSGEETFVAPSNDSYAEIMEVHCLL